MNTQFIWKEEYNIGVDVIDKEHKKLFRIINKIFTMIEDGKDSQWACQEGIKYFKGHALKHFSDEEDYMQATKFEGREIHKHLHDSFRENTLPALEQELERTSFASETISHFLGVCAGWLIGHTLTEDQAMVGRKKPQWESLLPKEEYQAMRQFIVQLIFDIFHMDSHMISDTYNGEKFGQGVYCRFIYGRKNDDKRMEILFALEKELLINTVGQILKQKFNKLDNMLIHASRYVARQFEGQFVEHFFMTEKYELLEENLLSYEQFRQICEKEEMQSSLLFNVGGVGYFAHCVIAPHLLEKSTATPIEHENAAAEVEKYLSEMEQQERQIISQKKILLVDDSITIREAMSKLLEKDYNVSAVSSGMAAIRSVTLNVPDLIILDYEMPICDGRQTLEMLRSEEDFSKIPVIFLTGRRDTNSILQVMPLKPADYLLKDSKPTDIKKKIDKFFEKQLAH